MNFSRIVFFVSLSLLGSWCGGAAAFEFKNNDRIVLLGGTLVEREQKYGFLETELQLATPGKTLSVRNLGWSGDTVFGHARSYFGPPAEGLQRLGNHLEQLKPTVLVACYGADMPFEGLIKLPAFITGYRNLLDLARSKSPNLRVIIVSPPPFENMGTPMPDLTEANVELGSVRDALKEFAAKQDATFVDVYELMGAGKKAGATPKLTDNGVHFNEAGYRVFVQELLGALQLPKVDVEQPLAKQIRATVVHKDFLFFNRWRPANETYLHGFRKHEQGQNAKEMEQFDPLVAAQEKRIAELKAQAVPAEKLP
ncbi:hypothetical protein FEM03_23690 [Phragmitibacter flavus]|uniref:SGNH hydrolase-type esterase domain-containing protein n=1 Tax=Phragmitibacter flavus TaxID=2576071 RepID=A0A5R8K7E2_9BACT|nr:SGNH/GDSL hydrolase family protein [Phragmitibacter flavus]TLD68262.1 hypothetical protein FEM03_23690 [Phragmitibacter flavus]